MGVHGHSRAIRPGGSSPRRGGRRSTASGGPPRPNGATGPGGSWPSPGTPGRRTPGPISDDRLRLIFTCCHPALALDAQVALTLRSLGGLTTDEVARAFLVAESTLAQRIVRAKRKIREAGIPYRIPSPDEFPERLGAVLAVVYLIFNAGYLASSGAELVRVDLCDEGVRLAGLVVDLLPDEPEPLGLAALAAVPGLPPDGPQRRPRPAAHPGGTGPGPLGRRPGDGRPGPAGPGPAVGPTRSLSAEGGHRRRPRRRAGGPRRPTGPRSCGSTTASSSGSRRRWCGSTGPWPWPWPRGPDAGLALLDDPALAGALDDYHLYHSTRADLLRTGRASGGGGRRLPARPGAGPRTRPNRASSTGGWRSWRDDPGHGRGGRPGLRPVRTRVPRVGRPSPVRSARATRASGHGQDQRGQGTGDLGAVAGGPLGVATPGAGGRRSASSPR